MSQPKPKLVVHSSVSSMSQKGHRPFQEVLTDITETSQTDSFKLPYEVVGIFEVDFKMLCEENNIPYVPAIIPHPHPDKPTPPVTEPTYDLAKMLKKMKRVSKVKSKHVETKRLPTVKKTGTSTDAKDGDTMLLKDGLLARSSTRLLSQNSLYSNIDAKLNLEADSQEQVVKEKLDYRAPCIQVDYAQEDGDKTVTEIYIRSWKVDVAMMGVFQRCLPALPFLQSLHLWNTGLAKDTLQMLGSFLPHCYNLKTLVLDANTLTGTDVTILFQPGSFLENVSLRFCGITDAEAYGIGSALNSADLTLLTLNLSNNHIGNQGAIVIAEGLTINRTLLVLNLASNHIGDEGVARLSVALSHFPLSQKQIVERRQLIQKLLEKENTPPLSTPSPGRRKSPALLPRPSIKDVRDRKPTVTKPPKSSKKDKQDQASTKGSGDKQTSKTKSAQEGRQKSPKAAKAGKKQRPTLTEVPILEEEEEEEKISPLTEIGELRDGQLWLPGNRTLISLNLSRNRIGVAGFKALLEAVEAQQRPVRSSVHTPTGLLRLVVHRNAVPEDDERVEQIHRIMRLKDPYFRSPSIDLRKSNITPCSIPIIF